MRHLCSVYTQRYNRLHKKDGPLFKGRYKAILVQEDEYLTHLIRYIHLNPVQANLTDDLSQYPYTSHKDYLKGKDNFPWLSVRHGVAFFAGRLKESVKAYRVFIKEGIDPKTLIFYNKKNQPTILGEADFVEKIRNKYLLSNERIDTEIAESRTLTGKAIAAGIAIEVLDFFKTTRQTLYRSKRGEANPARFMALCLTQELSGLTQPEIADLFKIKSYRTVGTACYRFKTLLDHNKSLKKEYGMSFRYGFLLYSLSIQFWKLEYPVFFL